MKNLIKSAGIVLSIIGATATQSHAQTKQEIETMQKQLKQFKDAEMIVKNNLKTFDTLDYTVFTKQEWERFHESHGENIKVIFPDGHIRYGLKNHIEDMKALFVYAPDTKIRVHPIKLGSGDWTAVTGVMEGTFTKPMPLGNGKFLQPTGKKFALPMATFSHWKDGVMIEEDLFWDNKYFMDTVTGK